MNEKAKWEAAIITIIIIAVAIGFSFLIVKINLHKENKTIEQKKEQGFYPVFSKYCVYFVKFQKGFYIGSKSLCVRCLSDNGILDACITIDLSNWGVYPENKNCAFINPCDTIPNMKKLLTNG